jgi:hypothetical protein
MELIIFLSNCVWIAQNVCPIWMKTEWKERKKSCQNEWKERRVVSVLQLCVNMQMDTWDPWIHKPCQQAKWTAESNCTFAVLLNNRLIESGKTTSRKWKQRTIIFLGMCGCRQDNLIHINCSQTALSITKNELSFCSFMKREIWSRIPEYSMNHWWVASKIKRNMWLQVHN